MENMKKKVPSGRRNALWGFLVANMVLLVTGTFILLATGPASLPKATNLSGAGPMICTIIALAITD